ncbi:C-type lectin APL-like [Watersipora subatra]|uniref:C-type lectin APL-like n=1 Tax=Watersipora subatra TaxID=2589382 RepID=UPI00355C0A07
MLVRQGRPEVDAGRQCISNPTPKAQSEGLRLGVQTLISCPSLYVRNPYSNTCITCVSESKAWEDAKIFCESRGEYLATFETVESAFWLVNLRKTDPDWQQVEEIWLGGRKINGTWRWDGKSTALADTLYWGQGRPSVLIEECLTTFAGVDYQFNDKKCHYSHQFICEKTG